MTFFNTKTLALSAAFFSCMCEFCFTVKKMKRDHPQLFEETAIHVFHNLTNEFYKNRALQIVWLLADDHRQNKSRFPCLKMQKHTIQTIK
jgi:hypothetical protein